MDDPVLLENACAFKYYGSQYNTPSLRINGDACSPTMVIQTAASQTGNALEIRDSSGTLLAYIDSQGNYCKAGEETKPDFSLMETLFFLKSHTGLSMEELYELGPEDRCRLTQYYAENSNKRRQ